MQLCPFSPQPKCFEIVQRSGRRHWVTVASDFALGRYAWVVHLKKSGKVSHVSRRVPNGDGTKRQELLHHVALGKPEPGLVIDHRDGNPLNNQPSNLRFCTNAENSRNRELQGNNALKTKGVRWHHRDKKFHARITVHGKQHHIGSYDTLQEAKAARAKAETELFGEFARTK
jgi:hypothetical protein